MSDFTLSGLDFKSDDSHCVMLEWAVNYAQAGIPVFPLIGKEPMEGSNGFYDPTTDLETIENWWRRHPNANIGIPTGNASGFWVLDIDGEEGQQTFSTLQTEHEKLHTPVISRTGKGHHLLFKMNGRDIRNRTRFLPGLDARGIGGYIVAPPSIHPKTGTAYSWVDAGPMTAELEYAPDWLCDLVEKKAHVQSDRTHPEILPQIDHDHPYVRAAVDAEVRIVATARAVSDRVGSAGSWGFTSGGKFASLRFAGSLSRWERCRARYRRT